MFERAEPSDASRLAVRFITASGLTYPRRILSIPGIPLAVEERVEGRDVPLHARPVAGQLRGEAVQGRADESAREEQDDDHRRHDEHDRQEGREALPLEPEHGRRPERGEEGGDEEGRPGPTAAG